MQRWISDPARFRQLWMTLGLIALAPMALGLMALTLMALTWMAFACASASA
jgi:hypothetical protein